MTWTDVRLFIVFVDSLGVNIHILLQNRSAWGCCPRPHLGMLYKDSGICPRLPLESKIRAKSWIPTAGLAPGLLDKKMWATIPVKREATATQLAEEKRARSKAAWPVPPAPTIHRPLWMAPACKDITKLLASLGLFIPQTSKLRDSVGLRKQMHMGLRFSTGGFHCIPLGESILLGTFFHQDKYFWRCNPRLEAEQTAKASPRPSHLFPYYHMKHIPGVICPPFSVCAICVWCLLLHCTSTILLINNQGRMQETKCGAGGASMHALRDT